MRRIASGRIKQDDGPYYIFSAFTLKPFIFIEMRKVFIGQYPAYPAACDPSYPVFYEKSGVRKSRVCMIARGMIIRIMKPFVF